MASAGSIFVDLLLRDSQYAAGWNRARRTTKDGSVQIQRDLDGVRASFQNVLSPVNNIAAAAGRLGAALAGALSVQRLVQYSDTWRQLSGRLSLVSSNMNELTVNQQNLFEIAQRTRQPLEGVISFYARLNQFIPQAERAQYDLLGVTENVASALAITGETGESASAALVQFTQAIGTNFEAAGQELRSLQEQAPRLTQALQRALGDGTKSLQKLKEEGKLSRASVLNALSGIGIEGQKLRAELDKLPVTVGQAFQKLDNAFLRYIGQNQLVNQGTSSLSALVVKLSENIETLGNIAATAAIIIGGRFVLSIAASVAQMVALNLAVNVGLISLGRMVGISAAASTAILTLSAALKAVSLAFAVLIPVAAIAALYEVIDGNESLIATEQELANVIGTTRAQLDSSIAIHGTLTKEAIDGVNDRIKAYKNEVTALEEVIKTQLDNRSTLGLIGRGIKDFAGETVVEGLLGQDYSSLTELTARQQKYNETVNTLNGLLTEYSTKEKPGSTGGNGEVDKKIQGLYEKNLSIITGLNQETIDYRNTLEELNKVKEAGLITDQQMIDAIARLDEKYLENTKTVQIWGVDIEEFGKRAASNIQDAFADFLFDPFKGGIKDMAKNFIDSVRRMIAEAQAAQLAKSLFGSLGGGTGNGIFGSILGSVFGSGNATSTAVANSISANPNLFADGGYLGPGQWGIAGEAGAELLYGGKTGVSVFNQDQAGAGKNTYYIDARGADAGAVQRIEKSLLALAGPGVIESRVAQAQVRGGL